MKINALEDPKAKWVYEANRILGNQLPSRLNIQTLCQLVSTELRSEPNLVFLYGDFFVVGDIHG